MDIKEDMHMYFVDNKGITDPRVNLAIEEYACKKHGC